MDKLYKVELKGIGEIIADLETLEHISDVLLEAAGYNNDMIMWCDKAGQNSASFYETFDNRINNHECLRDYIKEVNQ